jgi:peptidyl-tRNA hydrolase, PTH1 family
MKLIAGLGNPSKEYAATRHNMGFDAVTAISDAYGIKMGTAECEAITGKGIIAGEKVMLAMPQTFMNLSGRSIAALAAYYKIEIDDIIVICDDIYQPVGQMRIRPQGSAGGHNGLKNIISALGCDKFCRIRIGVGNKPDGWELADFVLGHFPKEEEVTVREVLGKLVSAVSVIITDGIPKAMEKFNVKLQKPQI